jgi:hypothetical protein
MILMWRECQNPAEFLQRVRNRQKGWQSSPQRVWLITWPATSWIERVMVQVNPWVPAYFIALRQAVSRLLGQPYEKALAELESCCRTAIHGPATLGDQLCAPALSSSSDSAFNSSTARD